MLDLTARWEGYWQGERVYIEVKLAPIIDRLFRKIVRGLAGHSRAQAIMLYGNTVVARQEVKENLSGAMLPYFELVGHASVPGKPTAKFRAAISQQWLCVPECVLTIDDERVEVKPAS